MTARKPSVLVIAEAANPEWVSVPLVGWSMSQALRGVANAHLVTQVRNREAILAAGLVEGRDFTAIDTEAIARPMVRLANRLAGGSDRGWTLRTAINSLIYPYFERQIWKRFSAELRAGEWDLVHRITPVSPSINSPLASRCAKISVPFVLGPINGGVPWPPGFASEQREEKEWLSHIRNLRRYSIGRRRMFQATSAILVGSRTAKADIPSQYHGKTHYLPENAIDTDRFSLSASQEISSDVPLRACFIGRLVPLKGVDMLIEAAADLVKSRRLVLDIIGDGPMRPALEAQVKDLAIEDSVTFHGMIAHAEVQGIAVKANLLTFPSIREFGGGVVLEAMSLGVVPVVVDYGGPAELVTDETGFKVPIGDRTSVTAELRNVLERIAADPSQLPAMGQAARELVASDFTWPAKARQISEIYSKVLTASSQQ